ncbi:hypothetical protein FOXYSP1_20217 [Fusarium oxysporum f. sp. phaseoli]
MRYLTRKSRYFQTPPKFPFLSTISTCGTCGRGSVAWIWKC